MNDVPPWGIGPPFKGRTMAEALNSRRLYTVQAEHRHKPGRRFYLDQNLCLSTDAKNAKALPRRRAWLALILLRALAWLLADGAPGMTPKIVELLTPN